MASIEAAWARRQAAWWSAWTRIRRPGRSPCESRRRRQRDREVLAVFEKAEVFLFETRDRPAFAIADDHADLDERGFGAQDQRYVRTAAAADFGDRRGSGLRDDESGQRERECQGSSHVLHSIPEVAGILGRLGSTRRLACEARNRRWLSTKRSSVRILFAEPLTFTASREHDVEPKAE